MKINQCWQISWSNGSKAFSWDECWSWGLWGLLYQPFTLFPLLKNFKISYKNLNVRLWKHKYLGANFAFYDLSKATGCHCAPVFPRIKFFFWGAGDSTRVSLSLPYATTDGLPADKIVLAIPTQGVKRGLSEAMHAHCPGDLGKIVRPLDSSISSFCFTQNRQGMRGVKGWDTEKLTNKINGFWTQNRTEIESNKSSRNSGPAELCVWNKQWAPRTSKCLSLIKGTRDA